jgi:hypothetical protein
MLSVLLWVRNEKEIEEDITEKVTLNNTMMWFKKRADEH